MGDSTTVSASVLYTDGSGFESQSPNQAPIAQMVELRTFNPQVVGSSPTGGTELLGGAPRKNLLLRKA